MYLPLHEIVRPVGLLALHARIGKDPITIHRINITAFGDGLPRQLEWHEPNTTG